MFNMGVLREDVAALEKLEDDIRGLGKDIGDAAGEPETMEKFAALLAEGRAERARAGAALQLPGARAGRLFEVLGAAARARAAFAAAAALVLRPATLSRASARMSATFTRELQRRAARLRAQLEPPDYSARVPGWAAAAARGDPGAVAAQFAANAGAKVVAQIYARVLAAWKAAGVAGVAGHVEAAKDLALGLEPDSPGRIERGLAGRRAVHPLQRLEISFLLREAPPPPSESRVAVNATLPQARADAEYLLANLIDFDAARKFGPVAGWRAGLSFRLLERLRTIVVRPVLSLGGDNNTPSIVVARGGPPAATLRWTTDNNVTHTTLAAPGGQDLRALGAGPRARARRLGQLAGAAAALLRAPRRLAERYGEAAERAAAAARDVVRGPAPSRAGAEISKTVLRARLEAEFARAFDALGPRTAAQLAALVHVSGVGGAQFYDSYVARAVGAATRAAYRPLLLGREAGLSETPLGRRAERRELLLTSLAQLGESIRAVGLRIGQAFSPAAAEQLYGGAEREPGAVRGAALRLFAALMDSIFRAKGVVWKQSDITPQMTRKVFLICEGRSHFED